MNVEKSTSPDLFMKNHGLRTSLDGSYRQVPTPAESLKTLDTLSQKNEPTKVDK